MAIRYKGKKPQKCFLCRKMITKGNWMWKHDNVYNKNNPKYFCSQACKLSFIFSLANTITLEHFV